MGVIDCLAIRAVVHPGNWRVAGHSIPAKSCLVQSVLECIQVLNRVGLLVRQRVEWARNRRCAFPPRGRVAWLALADRSGPILLLGWVLRRIAAMTSCSLVQIYRAINVKRLRPLTIDIDKE